MKKYSSLFILCFLLLGTATFAQVDDEVYDTEIKDEEVSGEDDFKVTNRSKRDVPRKQRDLNRKKFNADNLYVGTGAGFMFWGSQLNFDVSPHIGYRIGNVLAPAVGFNYFYANDFRFDVQSHIFGPKVMLRINPFGENGRFYLIGEYEALMVREKNPFYTGSPGGQPQYYTSGLRRANVGLGYTSNFGDGMGLFTEFMYDVLFFDTISNNPNGYPANLNPLTYRIGFYYGF